MARCSGCVGFSCSVVQAIPLLAIAVVEAAFRAPLIPAVGAAVLVEARFSPATRAAIALSPITVAADPENCLASIAVANSLPQNPLAKYVHTFSQKGLDNGSRSWQRGYQHR
jgi:hypothetical protein